MKVKLFREYGAGNSGPIFDAFEKGLLLSGDEVVDTYEKSDVVVIWSVLFAGRMSGNEIIWKRCQSDKKPCVVIEIGSLKRNITWRIALNGINNDAVWPTYDETDKSRHSRFNVKMKPWRTNGKYIFIATQRPDSLQWKNQPPIELWLDQTIQTIENQTKKPIVIRPHPRDKVTDWTRVHHMHRNVFFSIPQATGKLDEVDFKQCLKDACMVVNHSSGPAIDAVINGVPISTSSSSLVHSLSTPLNKILQPRTDDRREWLNKMIQTEWFVDEIEKGIPWQRLRSLI